MLEAYTDIVLQHIIDDTPLIKQRPEHSPRLNRLFTCRE